MCLSGLNRPTCPHCLKPMVTRCDCQDFPAFTPLGGTVMLARSLLAHFGVDYEQHTDVVAELEVAIGDELISLGREVLAERGLLEESHA